MSDGAGELRATLESVAEQLADLAIDRLRQAVDASDADRTRLAAEERRLTRARRAVEKAAALLDDRASADDD